MARVNIFVSSTCYDLSQVRENLKQCISDLGHNPILSEQRDFPINPYLSNAENCINAVKNEADIFVLIIGNRYGATLGSGKSITNTEFLTAVDKGIPIYTFALKEMVTLLPVWEKNPDADFSHTVSDNRIFEFLANVRNESGLWNFDFNNAQDIMETLKAQLSNLFRETLIAKRKIDSLGKNNLYLRVSSKTLDILFGKEDGYEMRFFLQAMHDEIVKYRDLKNDYKYSILVKNEHGFSNLPQLKDWVQIKLGQLTNFIKTHNKLLEAFKDFLAPVGVNSDIEGLFYVARSFAKSYASILEWGIEVRSAIVPKECMELLNALAELPKRAIQQIEDFPLEAMAIVEKNLEDIKNGIQKKEDTISLCLTITIDDDALERYNRELDKLRILI